MNQKRMVVKSIGLRQSARNQECTLNIPGVCNYSIETTVLCHYPSEIGGSKSTDISSGFGCSSCHAVMDDRSKLSNEDWEFHARRSTVRTQTVWLESGIMVINV